MGWVGRPYALLLHTLIPTAEVLCESAKTCLSTSSPNAQYPFRFSGRAMKTLTTRTFIYNIMGLLATLFTHVLFVAGNPSNPSKTVERGLLTGSGSV